MRHSNRNTVEHVVENGSREHVIHWDDLGVHCSEPNCEINRQNESLNKSLRKKNPPHNLKTSNPGLKKLMNLLNEEDAISQEFRDRIIACVFEALAYTKG